MHEMWRWICGPSGLSFQAFTMCPSYLLESDRLPTLKQLRDVGAFALADPWAPLVFTAGTRKRLRPSRSPAKFAHLWVGESALSDFEPGGRGQDRMLSGARAPSLRDG